MSNDDLKLPWTFEEGDGYMADDDGPHYRIMNSDGRIIMDNMTYYPTAPKIEVGRWLYGITRLDPITIGIHEMKLSGDRTEYYVFVRRGKNEITPMKTAYRNRAEYEVAEWKHVLLGWPKPDLMDEKYNDPPEAKT